METAMKKAAQRGGFQKGDAMRGSQRLRRRCWPRPICLASWDRALA